MAITSDQFAAITLRANSLIMTAQTGDDEKLEEGWSRFVDHLVNVVGIEG